MPALEIQPRASPPEYDHLTELWAILDNLDDLIEYSSEATAETINRLLDARNLLVGASYVGAFTRP